MRTFLLYPPHCYCCHHYSASRWDLVSRPPPSRKRASAVWSPALGESQHRTLLAIFGRPLSILCYCCFARSCSPVSQVRSVFDRSRFARHLDGRLLHSVTRRLHSWTRYSLVCCLSVPSCKLPPVVVSSPRVHRRCLGNHPSATFFRQRLTFTRFPRGKYLDFCSSKKLTNVTLWTRFCFLPCFGKL